MRGLLLILNALLLILAGGCESTSQEFLAESPHVVAVFREPPLDQSQREDGPLPFWRATAVVVSNRRQHGCLAPATLLIAAAPEHETMTAETLLVRTCLAINCENYRIGGRWLRDKKTRVGVFVFAYDSGGTAGRRIRGFEHWAVYGDQEVQTHAFFEVMAEDSRLSVYTGDFDGDGIEEIFVASLAAQMSPAPIAPRTYRVLSIEDGSAKVIAEVDEAVVLAVKDLEPL